LTDYMNLESKDFYQRVKDGLEFLNIEFHVNPHLVRGLDYYTHTVFEFVTTELGAQGTVLAGGRYDGLMELMGGPSMPGVGWAAGIERLAMLIAEPTRPARPVALIALGGAAEHLCLREAEELRNAGLPVEFIYSGNLQRRLTKANRLGARVAVIIGDNEIHSNEATIRDLDSGVQEPVSLGSLVARIKALMAP
jgi:histidyl-tRNA synthetase